MLHYTHPTLTSGQYAEKALQVLQEIETKNPEALAVMLRADIVLTLSGVRAQTPYIDLAITGATNKLVSLLQAHGLDMFINTSEVIEIDELPQWYLCHRNAVHELAERYDVDIFPVLKSPLRSFDSLVVWSMYVEALLKDKLEANNISNMWAPHNMRFGMLLGYPAKAIESYCLEPDKNNSQTHIAYHDMYDAAWPVYTFSAALKHDPEILEHQALWSHILTQVYESDWHKKLSTKN